MSSIYDILKLLLSVAQFIIFAHMIMSWLLSFNVLNIRQPLVNQLWYGLERILAPVYGPIRNFMPNLGGLDLSPLVALLAVQAIDIILSNNYMLFH